MSTVLQQGIQKGNRRDSCFLSKIVFIKIFIVVDYDFLENYEARFVKLLLSSRPCEKNLHISADG